jgi:hypothetical protein
MSLASLERRIADLEQRAREKSARRTFLSREEGLRLLARKIEESQAERAAFEALPVPAKIEVLRKRLAETIARWESGERAPVCPNAEVWERERRRSLEIQILELEGASAESVRAMRERNVDAVRKGRGLGFDCESGANMARWEAATAPAGYEKPAADFDPELAERMPFRELVDRLSDYRGRERETPPEPDHW